MTKVDQLVTAKFILDSTGFNSSIKGINAELRNAGAELKNASAQLGIFGRDSEKLKDVQEALTNKLEAHNKKVEFYSDKIKETTQKMNDNIIARDKLKDSLDKANLAYDEAVKNYGKESEQAKKAKEEVEKLTDEYKNKEKAVETNARQVQSHETALKNANAEMAKTQGELKKINDELAKNKNGWLSTSENLKKHSENLKKVGGVIEDVGKGILKATAPLVGIGVASLKAGIDFESAFAGVKKTVDGTEQELKGLEIGIKNMAKEIPASATAIAGVAESAGQLGIEIPNMLGFTRVMIDLGNATNLTGETAASSLAKFANITQMSQKDFDRLGSTIVALGNNLATTEADIVAMGMNLAGAGKQVGLTESQIMGFAGALSSVGIEAQAGGTAFSKLMVAMQLAVETGNGQLEDFARISGKTIDEFTKGFKEDATGAILSFVKGLSESEKQGSSAIKILDDMNIKETRLRDALLRAGSASDVFNNSIKIGTEAWKENTALTKEASQRYETQASKIEILKNKFVDAGIKIGEVLMPHLDGIVDSIGRIAEWLGNLDPQVIETTAKAVGLAVAVGGVTTAVGGTIKTVGAITGGLSTLTGMIGGTTAATATMGTAAGVAGGVGGMGALVAGLGGVVAAAAPFVAVGAAVVGAGYLIKEVMETEAVPAIDIFADKIEEVGIRQGRMGDAAEIVVTKISEATKTAVGSYMALDEGVKQHLDSIFINSQTITEQTKNELETKYNEMATNINNKIAEKRDENIANLQSFFANNRSITDIEQAAIMLATEDYYNNLNTKTTENQIAINEIIARASEERRQLTLDERTEITKLQDEMRSEAIRILSDNEIEAKIILERMSENDKRITAEQAAEHIKTLNESRDKAVEVANDEYDKRLATIIRMRDEAGIISADQADRMIEEAKRQRDGIINNAELTREQAISKMSSMNKELFDTVDISSGKILTAWDKLKMWWTGWTPETKAFEYTIKQVGTGVAGSLLGAANKVANSNDVNMAKKEFAEQEAQFYNLNKEAIEELARRMNVDLGVAASMYKHEQRQNGNVSVTQNIYAPVASPAEMARQAKKAQQELALGF